MLFFSIGGTIPCGPLDQAEVDARSDVLTFQTTVMVRLSCACLSMYDRFTWYVCMYVCRRRSWR